MVAGEMIRVLIVGGAGMLGHKLWQVARERFDTFATVRQSATAYAKYGIFDAERLIGHVSAQDFDSVMRVVGNVKPDVVVNCIGVVKQDAGAKDSYTSISINALFPHRLAQLCRTANARLIHLSTDCVFSGRRGFYKEADAPDAEDLYGRTKLLGEVVDENCLTLRTSMIGRELEGSQGLIEWFMSQEGKRVGGYTRAIFSGFTTHALAEIIAGIIERQPNLSGMYHVAAEPINKFDLLSMVKSIFQMKIEIEPNEKFFCDRSLDAERFRQATGFAPPTWQAMIEEMQQDSTPYQKLRRIHADG